MAVVGESDPTFSLLQEVMKKAKALCQARPVGSHCIFERVLSEKRMLSLTQEAKVQSKLLEEERLDWRHSSRAEEVLPTLLAKFAHELSNRGGEERK